MPATSMTLLALPGRRIATAAVGSGVLSAIVSSCPDVVGMAESGDGQKQNADAHGELPLRPRRRAPPLSSENPEGVRH